MTAEVFVMKKKEAEVQESFTSEDMAKVEGEKKGKEEGEDKGWSEWHQGNASLPRRRLVFTKERKGREFLNFLTPGPQ